MQLRVEPYNHAAIEARSGRNLRQEIARYDAIATFSNNVVNLGCRSRPNDIPTGYSDSENLEFDCDGKAIVIKVLCGGQARVMATAMLAVSLGEDLPSAAFVGGKETDGVYRSEAAIYHKSYVGKVRQLRDRPLYIAYRASSLPKDFGRESVLYGSQNSLGDIHHLIRTAQQRGWRSIAAITNEYHVKRLQLMSDAASKGISIQCYSAEEIICALATERAKPILEHVIESAYRQETAHNRVLHEHNGIEMLKRGTYRSGGQKNVA